jgi:hypothetical protein
MTAVVYDGTSIAADRRIMADNTISGYRKKIVKYKKGYFAFAGSLTDAILYKDYLNGKTDNFDSKSFHALIVTDGKVYESMTPDYILVPAFVPTGLGSGGIQAEVLCRVGYSARDAVQAVMAWDQTVGGKIDVVTV